MTNSEAKALKLYEEAHALREEQEEKKQPTPTIDSLHDEDGNTTFDEGTYELDCRYPVFDPHSMLLEMKRILQEVRAIRDNLGFFSITEPEEYDGDIKKDHKELFEDFIFEED